MTPILRDTSWQPAPSAAGAYRPWLTDRGSLTARIAARCPDIRVQVLFQGLRRPDRDERFLFADRGRARVLVREVFLVCRDVPVVFAHTVLAPTHLRGAWRGLSTLGSKPLGAALFADPRIERFALRTRKLGWHHDLQRRVQRYAPRSKTEAVQGSLWARRSLFRLHDSPILVTEVFLPEILRL